MSEQTLTATEKAIQDRQRDNRLAAAMYRLLDRLRPFMRAYPRTSEEMPEHDMVWETAINGGPEHVILEAIKANPALWESALPPDVCVVPRKMLEQISVLSPELIDYMASIGANMIISQALWEQDRQEALKDEMERRPTGSK